MDYACYVLYICFALFLPFFYSLSCLPLLLVKAFYLIQTCKLLNGIKHTNINVGLEMFWIWLCVLRVASRLFELTVFLQIFSSYSSLPADVRLISSPPQASVYEH